MSLPIIVTDLTAVSSADLIMLLDQLTAAYREDLDDRSIDLLSRQAVDCDRELRRRKVRYDA